MRDSVARPARVSPFTSRRGHADAPLLKTLLSALKAHDVYTYRHSARTVRMSVLIGRACNIAPEQLSVLRLGALVHDIGKVFVPGEVLHKVARLTKEEWESVRRHPHEGARLLTGVFPTEGIARVVAEHHEWWDGSGYPLGLRREDIDFNARVVAVADAFDAMTSERAYRPAIGYAAAAAELERCSGTQFDPNVVQVFTRVPRASFERIIESN